MTVVRFVSLELRRPGGFHPVTERLDEHPKITRVGVHHFQFLADGTLVLLYELRGNLDAAKSIIASHDDTLSFDVVGEEAGIAYVHGVPLGPISAFLEALSKSSVVVDPPVKTVENGAQFNFVGEAAEIRSLVDSIPDTFELEILRSGEYRPAPEQLSSLLTIRQEEVLRMALAEGYYDMPRRVTQKDVADELGITPETLNEHLRKIEHRVLSGILR